MDFIRWKANNTTLGAKREVIYLPFARDNFIIRNHHKVESIPFSWIAPTGKINFHGVDVAIPNDPEKVLAFRYPWTFGKIRLEFPYKWKCWVPCWLRKSNGCWIFQRTLRLRQPQAQVNQSRTINYNIVEQTIKKTRLVAITLGYDADVPRSIL